MLSGFKLLMILSTPFPLRPSAAIHFARHSRLPLPLPLEVFSSAVASRGRLPSVASSNFGFSIRAAEQVHTQALANEGCSETVTSYHGFKNSHSLPEWSKLAGHLLGKGYSKRQVTPGDQDDSMLTDKDLPEEFLRAAEACLDFARERSDILRLLTKKHIKAVVENGSPFLFKNGDDSVSRMRLFLSGDESTAPEPERAQTIDIMRYLLSYICKPYSSSNGYQLKDYESVETSVQKLLLELFNFSGTVWRSKMTEPTKTELPSGNELSRPLGQSIEMKRGDWICQKCTFMNFARNMNCLECGGSRPKRQLTGAEWECPQCDFFNYGRNTSCLRCDHKRPGDILLSPSPAGVGHTRSSNNEQRFSVPRQDSHGGRSIRTESADTSDSISLSLDRILGRSSTPSENMSTSGDINTSALGNFSPSQLKQNMVKQRRNPDSVPFVPLPPDMFSKTQESNNDVQQSSDKGLASSPNTSDLIDSLLKTSENSVKSGNSEEESSNASLRWSKTAAELENVKDPANAISDDDFPDIMPIRKGENRFVVSKKKDRSLTSPAYKRRLAMEQANNYNSVPFVPFPPGYFAKKDNLLATDSTESSPPLDEVEALPIKQGEQELGNSDQGFAGTSSPQSGGRSYGDSYKSESSGLNWNQNNSNSSYGIPTGTSFKPTHRSWDNRETLNKTQKSSAFEDNASYGSPHHSSQTDSNLEEYSGYTANSTQQFTNSWNNSTSYVSQKPNSSANYDFFSAEYTANSTKPSNNFWNDKNTSYGGLTTNSSQPPTNTWNNKTSSGGSTANPTQPSNSSWSRGSAQVSNVSIGLPQQSQNPQNTGKISSEGYSGKSLEGSCVKELDPLDMSEEAKAERWFRRAAQIKDISELSQIPDEDFPEIMPMRKGVNRFVVSKRKTPLERRLTSPQYRRNLPIMSSEPEKDADN